MRINPSGQARASGQRGKQEQAGQALRRWAHPGCLPGLRPAAACKHISQKPDPHTPPPQPLSHLLTSDCIAACEVQVAQPRQAANLQTNAGDVAMAACEVQVAQAAGQGVRGQGEAVLWD